MKRMVLLIFISLLFNEFNFCQNTGIGINTPLSKLHIFTGASGTTPNPGSRLTIEHNDHEYLNFLTPNNKENGILFGLSSNGTHGGIIYNNFANPGGMQFRTSNNLNRMVIDQNGNVGIGTVNPQSRLHVLTGSAGGVLPFFSALTIEHNANVFISLLTPDANENGLIFGLNSSNVSGSIVYNNAVTPKGLQFRNNDNQTRMVIDQNGNVGINNFSPTEKLDVNGSIKATKISYPSPHTHYYLLRGYDFTPGRGSFDLFVGANGNGVAFVVPVSNGEMTSPLHLPDGATITKMTAIFYDNSSKDLYFALTRLLPVTGSVEMVLLNSSGTPGNFEVSTTSISDPVIDNNLYGYEIAVFSPFGTWDAGLVLYAIKIEYTLSEAE